MTKPMSRLPSITSSELEDRLAKAQSWTNDAGRTPCDFPWASANDRVKVGYQLRMNEALHMKLKFLTEREPNTSMHKIIIDAIETEVALRLVKYIGEENAGERIEGQPR